MILDCSKYIGPCKCGREHTLETKKVVVEYDALDKFDQYMDEVGLTGKRAVIYDTNTYIFRRSSMCAPIRRSFSMLRGFTPRRG